jgi:glycosyltransferase involved in cell wall biosynthesis
MEKICAFGHFDPEGGRYWALCEGLQSHGFTVVECRTQAKGFFGKYWDLRSQFLSTDNDIAVLFVPFLGQYLMPLAWWLAKKRKIPLVMDAFLSLYDTEVHDRKRVSRWSPYAWLLWFADWFSCALADAIMIDTEEHKEYFVREFGISPEKILVIPIGCRSDIFTPEACHGEHGRTMTRVSPFDRAQGDTPFTVWFHGTFIPLQGIDTILKAAKILEKENIRFQFAGRGQTYAEMTKIKEVLQLSNVEFLGMIPMTEIPNKMRSAGACLGIFGTTDKALRVIPNKAYEILNAGCPLITERSPASTRVLMDGTHALLTVPGDPRSLADAILKLRNNAALRHQIAENGRRLSLEKFQPQTIVSGFTEWLRKSSSPASPASSAVTSRTDV